MADKQQEAAWYAEQGDRRAAARSGYPISVTVDGRHMLLPTVGPDGQPFTGPDAVDQAVAEYRKTGRHLGVFATAALGEAYAQRLHEEYAAGQHDQRPDAPVAEAVAQQAHLLALAASALSKRIAPEVAGAGWWEQQYYSGLHSLGANLPLMALGAIGGGVAAAGLEGAAGVEAFSSGATAVNLAAMGVGTEAQGYRQAREEGLGIGASTAFGAWQGGWEVLTEAMPAHVLFEGIAKKLPFAQLVLKELLPEVAGEEVATLTQNFGEWAMLPSNKNKTAMDYVREQPSAMAATLVSTLVMIGGTAAMGHVVGHAGTIIEQATGQSKLRERSPGAMEELVTKGVDGTNLSHVSHGPADVHRSTGSRRASTRKEAAAALTGNPDAYQAIEKGQQLVVPMGKHIAQVAGTEHGKFWSQEIRLGDAESMNLREFQQQDEVQAQMAETAGEAQAQAAAQPTARDHLVQALVAHGEPQRNAEQVADLWMGFFHNIAERAGIGPIYQRYGIRFQRPDMPGGQPVVTISAEALPKTATTVSHEERQQNKRAAFEMLVEHERQQPADSSEQAIARDPEGAHAERATERLAKWQALTDERGEPMFVYRMPNGSAGVRPSSTGRNENVVATLYPTPAEAAATPAPAQQGPQVTIERPGAPAVTHGERRERIPAGQQTGLEHRRRRRPVDDARQPGRGGQEAGAARDLATHQHRCPDRTGQRGRLQKAEERAKAEGMHVAVFDANNFKGYNDIHGHSAGNQLLITIGEKD